MRTTTDYLNRLVALIRFVVLTYTEVQFNWKVSSIQKTSQPLFIYFTNKGLLCYENNTRNFQGRFVVMVLLWSNKYVWIILTVLNEFCCGFCCHPKRIVFIFSITVILDASFDFTETRPCSSLR